MPETDFNRDYILNIPIAAQKRSFLDATFGFVEGIAVSKSFKKATGRQDFERYLRRGGYLTIFQDSTLDTDKIESFFRMPIVPR